MNWDALGAIAEMAGAVGVIVSLLYLGAQIRLQNRESQLNSVSESTRQFNDVLASISHNPDLCDIWLKGITEFENLDAKERARFSAHTGRVFRVVEGLYEYHLEGRMKPHAWEAIDRTFREVLGMPGLKLWWRSRAHWYGTPFQTYITEIVEATKSEPDLYGTRKSDPA